MNNLPTDPRTEVPERRRTRSWLSDLTDAFAGFPSLPAWRPMFADHHLIRLEEEVKDGHYLVHAEVPGIDPAKDVDISVRGRELTIKAERTEKKDVNGRSEFSYGSFVRTVTLPAGADAEAITASYDKGILTVDVAVPEQAAPEVKRIAVQASAR